MTGNSGDQPRGRLRRMFSRLTTSPEELQAEELRQDVVVAGFTPIAEAGDREVVTVSGTLRTVTLRPRAGVPALEAELFDGTDALDVVWLGRHTIAGIEPGRRLSASGRISHARGRRVLFNPRYELRPVGQGSESQ
ncbi:OB-fold nucleic acid binding domain-containing protein [Kitasatospora sp. RB6PN24]|uniref:OB-fold nucleic acid binding domain-containing protein n=1 Tax=Kitasatospora humi TaxID=2893891 RepID=UPI001E4D1E6E|nr:OB-fold nucleic acid binding domain-containing protein [Kitasatospora humi]MCC9312460.1 OB-fold nucleic acid binding domain-containing protein [Kitasatospora humi]